MNDLKRLVADRTGRRVTDASRMWCFVCGVIWGMALFMMASAI